MKKFTTKRVLSVLLGMILPSVLILVILFGAMQRAYLRAADSFGEEFGQAMAQQAKTSAQTVTSENWNSLNIAAAGLPDGFDTLPAGEKASLLQSLAASQQGRGLTFFYYSQTGECVGSDGAVSTMHYTSRADISSVLAGTDPRTMYGPLFEGGEGDDEAAAQNGAAERSGYMVYYTVPVTDAEGVIQGALSLRRDAYEYCDAIADLSFGDGGYTCLYDGAGTVVAVSRGELLTMVNGEQSVAPLEAGAARIAARQEAGGGGSVLIPGGEFDGSDATVVYTPVSDEGEENSNVLEGWSVLVYLPRADLEGQLMREAANDVTDSWITWLAVVLLAALAVLYVALDALRARSDEARRRAQENKDVLEQTLRALAGTYEARKMLDSGHGYRVGAYAREIGRHLGLDENESRRLYFEAVLHDVGMVAVPETILEHQAQQKLTAAEAMQLRDHVTVGGRILGRLTALPGIGQGAMYHHMHYDGNGYCSSDAVPLKGEKIPLTARIIAVADHYDHFAASGQTGIDLLLEEGKGKVFDPMLADIMIQLVRDGTIAQVTARTEETLRGDAEQLAEV